MGDYLPDVMEKLLRALLYSMNLEEKRKTREAAEREVRLAKQLAEQRAEQAEEACIIAFEN